MAFILLCWCIQSTIKAKLSLNNRVRPASGHLSFVSGGCNQLGHLLSNISWTRAILRRVAKIPMCAVLTARSETCLASTSAPPQGSAMPLNGTAHVTILTCPCLFPVPRCVVLCRPTSIVNFMPSNIKATLLLGKSLGPELRAPSDIAHSTTLFASLS